MKNTLIFFLLCIGLSFITKAQNKQTYNLPTFSRISFAGAGKVYVTQDATQTVTAQGSNEVLEKYEIEVEAGRLTIKPKDRWLSWDWGKEDEITVYITVADIDGLTVAGSGDVVVKNRIKTNKLNLRVSGSGYLQVETDVKGDLEANVSGSGDIKISGTAYTFDSSVSGSGDVNANVVCESTSSFGISGSGKVLLQGKSKSFNASISGSGSIKGENFSTQTAKIKIAGSGSVDLEVTDELDVSIAGSGDVRYRGNPKKVNSHAGGSGSVRKIG
jgi:hypothetical protein